MGPTQVLSAPTLLESQSASAADGVTSDSFAVTSPGVIFAFGHSNDSTVTGLGITDTFGAAVGPWTQVQALYASTGGSAVIACWWAELTGAASGTVTISRATASCGWGLTLVRVNGAHAASPVVQSATNSGQSTVLGLTLPATPTPGNLVLCALTSRDTTPTRPASTSSLALYLTGAPTTGDRSCSVDYEFDSALTNPLQYTTLTSLNVNAGVILEVHAG